MIRIIYTSKATREVTENELQEILNVSRRNNAQVDVTGILLYRNGVFFQVLEGPADAVHCTYDRIEKDPRHAEVEMMYEEEIEEREFPNWEMGYINMQGSAMRGFTDFLMRTSPTKDTLDTLGDGERYAEMFKNSDTDLL